MVSVEKEDDQRDKKTIVHNTELEFYPTATMNTINKDVSSQ